MAKAYEENIQRIAEAMATASALKTKIPHFIPDYYEAARIALGFTTEELKLYRKGWSDEDYLINHYLHERGLIPAQEGENYD